MDIYLFKQDYDNNNVVLGRVDPDADRNKLTNNYKKKERKKVKLEGKNKWSVSDVLSRCKLKVSKGFYLKSRPIVRKKTIEKRNKSAILEDLSTKVMGSLGMPVQETQLIKGKYNNGKDKYIIACKWKKGLETFEKSLGGNDDKNRILANGDNSDDSFKDVGSYLIHMILWNDYDGMGKNGQNKGYTEDDNRDKWFFGFDIGKAFPRDVNDALNSLQLDFSFQAGELLNHSVFKDFTDVEKMSGIFFIYKAMSQEIKNKIFTKDEQQKIEEMVDLYANKLPEKFREQYDSIIPGHYKTILNSYLNDPDFEDFKEDISKMKKRLTSGCEYVLRLFKSHMMQSPQTIDMLQSMRLLTSKTSLKDNGINLKHPRALPDNKYVWSINKSTKKNGKFKIKTKV